MSEGEERERRAARLALAIAALLLCAWVLVLAPRGFFSGDSGMKFAQAQALLDSGFRSRALPYDEVFDPTGRYHPYGDLVVRIGDERQGVYSWTFTGATAPLIASFGLLGTLLLPLLGGLATLAGIYQAGVRMGSRPSVAAAAAGFGVLATPVFFYSAQYAEHTLATGLCALALARVVPSGPGMSGVEARGNDRASLALAGALCALAASVRPEAYCAVAALGLAVFVGPRREGRISASLAFLAGCLPVLLVYWGVNVLSAETWDVVAHRNRDRGSSPLNAMTMLFGEMRSPTPTTTTAAWLGGFLALSATALLPGRVRASTPGRVAWCVAALGFAGLATLALERSSGRTLTGLVTLTPLIGLGIAAGPWRPESRPAWIFSVLFVLQVLVLDTSGTAGGLQLGARLLMPALPVLVLLAAHEAEQMAEAGDGRLSRVIAGAPIALLALVSLRAHALGLPAALEIAEGGAAATQHAIEAEADVVVTQHWWESQVVAPVVGEGKRLYSIDGNPGPFIDRLATAGVERFVYVGGRNAFGRLADGRTLRIVERWPGLFDVKLVAIEGPGGPTGR